MDGEVTALVNANGMEVRFIERGGTIVSWRVPDRRGRLADVVPGYDTADEYAADKRFLGSLVGRYANRIARGRFVLDGVEHRLPVNDGLNHLHGGPCGFHRAMWRIAPFHREGASGAVLCLKSPDGDQGYPGALHARVTYTLSDDNSFRVDYSAITDAPTVVNLTQHTYFNLAGHDAGDILDHELTIAATYFTPVDTMQIPTGALRGVTGTAFDFGAPHRIGERIDADDPQLHIGGGYDHNFVLRGRTGDEPVLAARLTEPRSGRVLEIFTTEPGIQCYSGNHLHEGPPGKGGVRYPRHGAIALETQHFPDSPNQSHFPPVVLRPGGEYRSTTIYRFSAQ
jgi:aldose 1-epimerase